MRVIRAKTLGFCPGVRRAVELALKSARSRDAAQHVVLGEIVHNPSVTERFRKLGIKQIDEADIESLTANGTRVCVVIRSHGAAPAVLKKLRDSGIGIVDATCPKVAANQRAAEKAFRDGYAVVIAGDKGHSETLGIAGHAENAVIISSPAEAAAYTSAAPIALVAQTTISEHEYNSIRAALCERNAHVRDFGGICPASKERRHALEKLCGQVDAVVIVGGKHSANTRRLFELAVSKGLPAWHIENASELPLEAWNFGTLGISAGASTPDEDIDAVERALLKKL